MDSCGRKTRMPHAILIPFPGQGHINPMMHLALNLSSHGFLITFVLTDFSYQRSMQPNNKTNMSDTCDMIRIISIPDGLPPDDSRKDLVKLKRALENSMGPSVVSNLIKDINAKEEIHKLTCLIVDVNLCIGLNEVAQMHQIPLAALCTSPASNCALRYFSSRLVSLGMLNSDGTPKEDKMVKYLSSLPPLNPGELPWLYGGEYRFQQGIRMAEAIRHIKWILFNSFYEQEAPVLDELSTEVAAYPIGPLVGWSTMTTKDIPSFWQAEVKCLEWLDKQGEQSVIYVSFGSLAVWNERQVQEFAMGLEATRRPFLWVVRSDLVEGEKPVLCPAFLERIRDRGYIVSWAPQWRVLGHPSIACFVTHCGWNSIQESITMGVPMLCCPSFTDQFLNRTFIVDIWKVGLALNPNHDGVVEKQEFAKAVEKLLVGEEGVAIKKECMKLKSVAGNAVKEGGSSFNNYNLFVNAMKERLID